MRGTKVLIGLILTAAIFVVVSSWRHSPSAQSDDTASTATASIQSPGEKVQELSFDLLKQTHENAKPPPTFPKALSDMDGNRVRITGFITPYDDPQTMTKLIVLKNPGGCFFCNPPNINTVVFVRRRPKDPPIDMDTDRMTFEGTLHLWRSDLKQDDDASQFLFTIDNATAIQK
jgi:hypothetical protein